MNSQGRNAYTGRISWVPILRQDPRFAGHPPTSSNSQYVHPSGDPDYASPGGDAESLDDGSREEDHDPQGEEATRYWDETPSSIVSRRSLDHDGGEYSSPAPVPGDPSETLGRLIDDAIGFQQVEQLASIPLTPANLNTPFLQRRDERWSRLQSPHPWDPYHLHEVEEATVEQDRDDADAPAQGEEASFQISE